MSEQIIEKVSQVLSGLNEDKPWMTAKGLSKRLNERFSPYEIESVLMEHSKSESRTIRYSFYPSKKTLDLLWGHTKVVREKRYLPELHRTDNPEEFIEESEAFNEVDLPEDAPFCFISHNYRDINKIRELKNDFLDAEVGSWIFEEEIEQGGQINEAVQEAMNSCDYLVAYLSRQSIGSLWVRKELEVAISVEKKVFLFADGRDKELMKLFDNWSDGQPPFKKDLAANYCELSTKTVGKKMNSKWYERCQYFIGSLDEYIANSHCIILYPERADLTERNNDHLKLQNFSQFFRGDNK